MRAATGEVEGGGFYDQGNLAPAPRMAEAPAFGAELWSHLEGLNAAHGVRAAA